MLKRLAVTCLILVGLAACAAPYNSSFYGSGVKELEPGVYRVTMRGNGFTSYETVQTYWLYRIADLALENGHDGVEILSRLQLTAIPPGGVQVAASGPVYIPMYIPSGPARPLPAVEGDVRLLKRPFEPAAGRIFDAAKLKAALEPYVNGDKCSDNNVCPHVHRYLY